MESLWAEEGMGLRLGSITVNQLWGSGSGMEVESANLCAGAEQRTGEVRVAVVGSIDQGQYNGWGCTNGNVWMGGSFERFVGGLSGGDDVVT